MEDTGLCYQELLDNVADHLERIGFTRSDALLTANVFISADLKGRPTQGLDRIIAITDGVRNGKLFPAARPVIQRNDLAVTVFDANYGVGPVCATLAMGMAIEKAEKYGIGMVGVLNSSHIGMVSWYTDTAAEYGQFAAGFSTSSPAVAPPGGTTKVTGTNPIAYSYPIGKSKIVSADFSTSAMARNDVLRAKDAGEPVPPNCLLDPDGNPTQDPAMGLEGSILPMGGMMKGMLVNMLAATMAGPLIGGVTNDAVTGTLDLKDSPTKGDCFVCIKIPYLETFKKDQAAFMQKCCASSSEFRIPGSRSHNNFNAAFETTVSLPKRTCDFFRKEGVIK